jgi:hypothetical protein
VCGGTKRDKIQILPQKLHANPKAGQFFSLVNKTTHSKETDISFPHRDLFGILWDRMAQSLHQEDGGIVCLVSWRTILLACRDFLKELFLSTLCRPTKTLAFTPADLPEALLAGKRSKRKSPAGTQ